MLLISLLVTLCVTAAAIAKNAKNSIKSSSVDDILASLTLEEKIGQMVQIDISTFMVPNTDTVDYVKMAQWVNDYKIGSILNSPFSGGDIGALTGWNATKYREMIINIQNIAQSTPSKVPIIYGIDSIHGATFIQGAALFPQALATAASFDTEMAFNSAKVSSRDTRAGGIQWLFAPVLGLGLHPLWARFPETFGEDPYLAAQMGKAVIDGIQYSDTAAAKKRNLRADLTAETEGIPAKAAACMKHFIAYSFPVNGHDRSPVLLPDRMVKQLYMPSFQAAIDTGVMTAMESYQEVGGDPMVASESYLKTLLRKEMKFEGMMVTDYMEIENLYKWHKVSSTESDAVLLSMTDTTIDMSMVPLDSSFGDYLNQLVASGELNVSRIEDSARRVLQLKQDLGMFDTENLVFSLEDSLVDQVGSAEDWELSLNGSRAAITLLKNNDFNSNGTPVLPITAPQTANIFLTGPTADAIPSQTGGWSIHWQGPLNGSEIPQGISVLHGMKNHGLFGDGSRVTYNAGVSLKATDTSGVDTAAVAALAAAADYIVVCVGEGTYAEKPGDIDDLALPQGQVEYVELLRTYGKPVILVLIEGRPRLLHDAVTNSDAVLNAYVPGPKGGLAIAEALSGALVPSGRLPFNYPRHAGDIPYAYHHKPGDQCVNATNGAYITCQMEWEFGHGLSYTTFEYSAFTVTALPAPSASAHRAPKAAAKGMSAGLQAVPSIDEDDSLLVSVTVTNTGTVHTAAHSVLLFIVDVFRRVTPEYKLLKRFEKVVLAPGQQTTLTFTLNREDLKYVGINSRYVLESGEFRLAAGPQQDCRLDSWASNPLCQSFELQLSDEYYPVCDYACGMWGPDSGAYTQPGVCGNIVDAQTCRSTCIKQDWTWNYVDCIEQYYQESTCVNAYEMQCYDAFSMAPINVTPSATSSDDCDELTSKPWFFALITVLVALVSIAIGAALASFGFLSCKKRKLSSERPVAGVDRSNFIENQNPIQG